MIFLVTLLIPAVVFVAFVVGRRLVARAYGMRSLPPPFAEPKVAQYAEASPGARAAIAFAGPASIYAFAAVLFAVGYLVHGKVLPGDGTTVSAAPSRPAHAAGLRDGDRVTSVAGETVASWNQLAAAVRARPGESIEVVVEREGQRLAFNVTPGAKGAPDEGKIGVALLPPRQNVGVGSALVLGVVEPARVGVSWVSAIGDIAFGGVKGDLVGPVGIAKEAAKADPILLMGTFVSASMLPIFIFASLLLTVVPRPRKSLRDLAAAFDDEPAVERAPKSTAPYRSRLLARGLDAVAVVAVVLALPIDEAARSLIPWFVWIPLETALLATWGTTPGKWLFKIRVRAASGDKLGFGEAFHRTLRVWFWGFGMGMVPMLVVLPGLALVRMKRRGRAYWDELGGFDVVHKQPTQVP